MQRLQTLQNQLYLQPSQPLIQNQVKSGVKNFGKPVYIVAGKRTPIGSFLGKLSKFSAPDLGGMAIQGAMKSINLNHDQVDRVIMGTVMQSGIGLGPARQAAYRAGFKNNVPCLTLNQACNSSLKAVVLGAMEIGLGLCDVVIAGGMESMSNVPFSIDKHRKGHTYGDQKLVDELHLGLTDRDLGKVAGLLADGTSKKYDISRKEHDEFAILSYERTALATKQGIMKNDIIPIKISDKETLTEDEEYKRFNKEKLLQLRPAFSKDGAVTAANSSKINDAGSAVILMSEEKMKELKLKPLAKIIGYAEGVVDREHFITSPVPAIKNVLEATGLKKEQIDFFEINEAFAVTVLSCAKLLDLNVKNINIYGGAVSLGHPVGMSGGRLIMNLISALKNNKKTYGIASLCEGGGGGVAVLIQNIP